MSEDTKVIEYQNNDEIYFPEENSSYGLSVGHYFLKLMEMEKTTKISGLSVKDIERREFHTNY